MVKNTSKKKSKENSPEINIGVVGHIDHGKTTLLNKLTGKFTDTHSDELKRGITIKLGYADTIIYKCGKTYALKLKEKSCKPVRYVSFIDAPGHEMLMATMLSGSAIIDAAILVVAANEGIMPQTREHLIALQAKNIDNIIVVQNKIDLVNKEQALQNYEEIKKFLKGTIAEDSPIIPVSAQQGINIEKILEEIVKIKIPERHLEKKPIFLVARSFDINKPGRFIKDLKGGVIGGVLKQGKLKVGDEIEIKPGIEVEKAHQKKYETIKTKILSLHKGNQSLSSVEPGASIAIETSLDPSLTKTDSLIGCVASTIEKGKGNLPEITYRIKIKAELFDEILGIKGHKEVKPLKTKEFLMLSVNTTITVGTIETIKETGSGIEVEIALNIPIVALKGDKIGIARNIDKHWRLIGWGEIKD